VDQLGCAVMIFVAVVIVGLILLGYCIAKFGFMAAMVCMFAVVGFLLIIRILLP